MTGRLLWEPPPDVRDRTRIGRYLDWLADQRALEFSTYDDLWRWSVDDLAGFWTSVWDHFDVVAHRAASVALTDDGMPGCRWFPGATLNFAENVLRSRDDDGIAVIARSQSREPLVLTRAELRDRVARCRAGLVACGVGRGDRVAAYLPNIPETLVAFLAAASLGAVWSSCAPEFGTKSVIDRFRQIEPKVLLVVDGYRYGARDVNRADDVRDLCASLPSVETLVAVPYGPWSSPPAGAVSWDDLLAHTPDLRFEPVPFDHPLYVLYSSGTTGLPKPIVHGHGGILLEHLKSLALHCDLGPADRFFWFSTTGWMMWNYLVSGLLVGAAVVLFDGDPGHPDLGALWRLAEETETTYFGVGASFLMSCLKDGVEPRKLGDMDRIRGVGSTGSPLPPEGFEWVYEHVNRHLVLNSASGGTDVCTAFVSSVPLVPVYSGEISCRALGAKVESFDESGASVVGEQGELVVTKPMPSMPVGFWNDTDGSQYRAAYFDRFPGVWRHGDWITLWPRGSCTITGRSDATLNRGGVRTGTAEYYAVVEALPAISDSLVVHIQDLESGVDEILLFVVVRDGDALDSALRHQIESAIRANVSPRHVPNAIHAVPEIPRTLSGKKLEVPVKRLLNGVPIVEAASTGALANPGSLNAFVTFADARLCE